MRWRLAHVFLTANMAAAKHNSFCFDVIRMAGAVKHGRFAVALCFALIMTVLAGCANEEPAVGIQDEELQPAVASGLKAQDFTAYRDGVEPAGKSASSSLEAFYRTRNYKPIWVGSRGLTAQGSQLIQQLSNADDDALNPDWYSVAGFDPAKARLDVQELARTELMLSSALIRYAADLGGDHRSPSDNILGRAAAAKDFAAFLDGLIPSDPTYRQLREALRHYRQILRAGGWGRVPRGARLEPGATGPRIASVRERLAITGDLPTSAAGGPNFYDGALEAAVKRFQARHGLDVDGVAGDRTFAAMNVPVETRVAQIEQALHNLRGPDFRIGERGIIVNIPAAEARVIESGRQVIRSRVIVGRPDWPTPTLKSEITSVILNPTWTVPRKIALQEILPRIRKQGIGYLRKRKFRVFDGRSRELNLAAIDWMKISGDRLPYVLRQDPGPANPLGRVKFLFANPYGVYLHDTPDKRLFDRGARTLSHGCIRVEEATALALHLLKNEPGWDRAAYAKALETGRTIHIRLSEPIPVHLVSLFVWVGQMGEVHFRDDPYAQPRFAGAESDRSECPASRDDWRGGAFESSNAVRLP